MLLVADEPDWGLFDEAGLIVRGWINKYFELVYIYTHTHTHIHIDEESIGKLRITYWGIIGAGKVDEFPPNTLGIGLGRVGGNGGSRVTNEFVVGFAGACCFRWRFGLAGRFLE
jgi:hypothetical protein